MATVEHGSGGFIFEKSNFLNPHSRHQKVITGKSFNHQVEVHLPNCESLPSNVSTALKRQTYWIVHNLKLDLLTRKEFIEAFVKRGQMSMLSWRTKIDMDNCIALTPKGILHLHIDKDTFEQLGLEGKPSAFNRKTPRKFVVEVDLTAPAFQPGKKNYDRVQWCLTDRLGFSKDMLFTWEPSDGLVCPSSAAAYFENNGFQVTRHMTDRLIYKSEDVCCPVVKCDCIEESNDGPGYQSIWEWLGALSLHIDTESGGADNYINTFSCPEPKEVLPHHTSCQLRGMVSDQCVRQICTALRKAVQECDLPWAAMTVHGFQDSPVTWQHWEHGYHHYGDNLYTYVIFPNEDYWLYMALGQNDEYS